MKDEFMIMIVMMIAMLVGVGSTYLYTYKFLRYIQPEDKFRLAAIIGTLFAAIGGLFYAAFAV